MSGSSGSPVFGKRFGGAALGVIAVATVSAHAQWTIVVLHPAGALNSEARSVFGAQQAGVADNAANALLWSGAAPGAVRLNPFTEGAAAANAVSSAKQGGSVSVRSTQGVGFFSHAVVWTGTASSWTDLHPLDPAIIHSYVFAMDGTSQVGGFAVDTGGGTFTPGMPCMWSGTSASWIDLTPPGFASGEARGVSGNQQVGATFDNFFGQACMWFGSAESYVNLQPADALFSAASCTDGEHQYGVIGILEPVPGLFPVQWSGSADSFVVFDVDDPETRWGEVHATHGGWQVGYTTDNDGVSNERACLWTGAPGTFLDLNQFLPSAYNGSNALGIWRHTESGTTYVVGYADNAETGQREAVMWVSGPGANLIVSPAAPANCSAAAGHGMTYSVRILNAGPDASGDVTLTVDLPPASAATFASADPPPSSTTPSQLVFNLDSIAGSGEFRDVSITLTAVGAGQDATITATATAPAEADPTNNSAAATSRIEPAVPVAATAVGIVSTNPDFDNSLIPGGAGRYTSLNHPVASPSGMWWIITAGTDQSAEPNSVLVRSSSGGSPAILARTGATAMSNGTLEHLDAGAEVNDSGLVAFAGDDDGPAASDAFIATTDGTSPADRAREGEPIPAYPDVSYGSNVGSSANIFASGQVGFGTDSDPEGNNAYLSNDGHDVVARVYVTFPIGSADPVGALLLNSTGVWGLAFDATGAHSIYQANLNTKDDSTNQVIVVDGAVVMQEGITVLDGLLTPVDGNNKFISMGAGGDWLVRGSNIDPEEDWVARGHGLTIEHVFKVGDPVFDGATELWREDAVVTSTFFAQTADAAGNYIVGGATDSGDDFTDSVLVFNNTRVVARENDPVDLDGNGQFDDGAYIRSFDNDNVALVPGALLAVVTLRDADAALCHTNNDSIGQALIRIRLSCPADFNLDGTVNSQDFFDFLGAFFNGSAGADFNHDQAINSQDFFDFLAAFFAGC